MMDGEAGDGAMRQLTRSKDQRMIGGVCGGMAEYLVVDPTVVRLGWALISLFWGAGIVLYLAALIIVPEAPSSGG